VVLVATQVRSRWGEVRPVRAALKKLDERNPGGSAAIAKSLHKFVYEALSSRLSGPGTSFLNYGYAPVEPPHRDIELPPELENDRFGMQLYNRVAGGADITGKDVLEVGCGRGGGAAFVFDRFKPASMVGLDLAERAVAHCNATHGREGLEFRAGDAENLPFADGSFDAVLNVESSHCYPNVGRFFEEVARVLRPGGFLVMADLRPSESSEDTTAVDELRSQITAAGLEIVEEEDITRNVVRSLELDTPRRVASVEDNVPKILHAQVLDFAGVVGTQCFINFDTGLAKYTRFAARKP
jgi:SAM-dependent methyltransferase